MNILFVTSEVFPYAKTGGLADAVYALASELALRGHRVIITVPKYGFLAEREDLILLEERLPVTMGIRFFPCSLRKNPADPGMPNVEFIFIDYDPIFGREGIYGSPGELDFSDNLLRFALLSKAALEYCRTTSFKPDVIHGHDWPGVPALFYARYGEGSGFFSGSSTVFTIHNIGYQGVFDAYQFNVLGLPDEVFRAKLEKDGQINLLKGGILEADMITTVSPTYAEEVKTEKFGFGLEQILTSRTDSFSGILNGVDYSTWNPGTDKFLPVPFSAENMEGKKEAKNVLQERSGLPREDVPLIGMVSRLVEQKGFGELCRPGNSALYNICSSMEVQMVILGTGEEWIQKELVKLGEMLPNLRVTIGYDEELAHLIEGGSDFFLMPSQYEPCGLNQMYSLKYGAIPIVRFTGGLADTVAPVMVHESGSEGTGFVIRDSGETGGAALVETVRTAVEMYRFRRDRIFEIRDRGMVQSFTWEKSAEQYEAVYRESIRRRPH
ncbi:MAG: glycogen synthase [Spirochaetia bacterium]